MKQVYLFYQLGKRKRFEMYDHKIQAFAFALALGSSLSLVSFSIKIILYYDNVAVFGLCAIKWMSTISGSLFLPPYLTHYE